MRHYSTFLDDRLRRIAENLVNACDCDLCVINRSLGGTYLVGSPVPGGPVRYEKRGNRRVVVCEPPAEEPPA